MLALQKASSTIKPCIYSTAKQMHFLMNKTLVNGEWISATNGKTFSVVNPATMDVIGSVPDMSADEVEGAVEAAKNAFKSWRYTTPKERSILLRNWFNLMESNKEELAKVLTAEAGKPLHESVGEITYGNSFVEWYSEEARRLYGDIVPSPVASKKILVMREPLGVVALITPWNFPHAMIARKAAAALACGCTCVIKPSEDTPLTALAMGKLAEEAGFPKGVINVVTCDRGNAASIGNILCGHNDIAGISFTGSTAVGRILYQNCAKGIKKLSLELGGKAPFIIFKSANIDNAVTGAMAAKFRNCGQACVAANRFIVEEQAHDAFVEKFKSAIEGLKLGDGTCKGVTVGPLINQMQMNKVSEYVNDAIKKGATVLIGGKPASNLGKLFYEPTIITGVTKSMLLYNEEVFGPVATILKVKNEEEALEIANDSNSGLSGYFYSEDVSQIFRVSNKLEVGMIGVNEGIISTSEIPFGGIKESGLGREGGRQGLDEYSEYKYVCIGNLK